MAKRPIFVPHAEGKQLVSRIPIEFVWHPGLSKSQKQKSIRSLHESARRTRSLTKILEISSKSELSAGIRLSAFNLLLEISNRREVSVESVFQGSKVFTGGGPFLDIYDKSPKDAKKDPRLSESGKLLRFEYAMEKWPLSPQTAFYDWLYLSALVRHQDLSEIILKYDAFSDIEFNPAKSINCQAHSAALYRALADRELLTRALSSRAEFLRICESGGGAANPIQGDLL